MQWSISFMTAIIMFEMLMKEIGMIMMMMMLVELAYHHYWAGHYTTHGSSSNIEAHPHTPHATWHYVHVRVAAPQFASICSPSSSLFLLCRHFSCCTFTFFLLSTWIWNTIAKKTIYIYTIHIYHIYKYIYDKNFPICPRGNSRRRDVVKFLFLSSCS